MLYPLSYERRASQSLACGSGTDEIASDRGRRGDEHAEEGDQVVAVLPGRAAEPVVEDRGGSVP